MTDDVVLVGCGGGAYRVLHNTEGRIDIPTIFINANSSSSIKMVDDDVPGSYGDIDRACNLAIGNEGSIKAAFAGKRVVMVFTVLGGGTGNGMMPEILRFARECGCRVISIAGIPMLFEHDRRGRAMDILPDIVADSDRTLILDMEFLNRTNSNLKFRNLLSMVARTIAFSIDNLGQILEGPFFSTFTEHAYTIAYSSDIDPANAVKRAMDLTMFETDPACGKMVVTVSSGFGLAETESIYNTVVGMTGIIPDIVKRSDLEDTKVLVFLPVRV